MSISDRIQRYRKACGLTIEQLAETTDISVQDLSDWESGLSSPDFGNLIVLSRAFGVGTDALLVGNDEPQSHCEVVSVSNEDDDSFNAATFMDAFDRPYKKRRKGLVMLAAGVIAVAGGAVAIHAISNRAKVKD